MRTDSVVCPNCNARIPISKLLTEQIRSDLERDFQIRLRSEEAKLRDQADRQIRRERARVEAEAVKKAEAKTRSEVERARREAANQSRLVQKLTTQLEKKDRTIETEIKRRMQGTRKQIEADVEERLDDEYRGRELEAQRRLSDARIQITNLKRKLDDSSRQIQGEVMEERLVDLLTKAFA